MGHQVAVSLAEVMVPEEAAVCREGRRVDRLKDEVAGGVDEFPFLLGIASPEHKNQVVALFGQEVDDTVGEGFPSFVLV